MGRRPRETPQHIYHDYVTHVGRRPFRWLLPAAVLDARREWVAASPKVVAAMPIVFDGGPLYYVRGDPLHTIIGGYADPRHRAKFRRLVWHVWEDGTGTMLRDVAGRTRKATRAGGRRW